ncbi:glucokinase [Roseibium sp. Sym1]|uniref:glucokinase n=1 Tax=Roseibium sp. Sym1 TaxID=3016006 RepID=UPI0022B333F4|nr:glucokinase [Roseibium sp. Sym1]
MTARQGLAADIGGTNTRLALVEYGRVLEETITRYRNRDFDTPEEAIDAFLAGAGNPACGSAVIAIAAPINGKTIRMTNHPWTFDATCIGRMLGGADVTFLNDFEALAYSLDRVAPERLKTVCGSAQTVPGNATRLVVGAGTGFNAAALFQSDGGLHVGTGECGHATLAVETEAELRLWKYLARGRGRASVERALSGQGLREIYEWHCLEQGLTPEDFDPANIASRANASEDSACEAAARQWVTFLGRVIGDLALVFLSLGGIVLTGGVTRSLSRFLAEPEFQGAFRAKGRQRQLVSGIPVHLLDDDFAALSGCAARM